MKVQIQVGDFNTTVDDFSQKQIDDITELFQNGSEQITLNFNNGPVIMHQEYYKSRLIVITEIK